MIPLFARDARDEAARAPLGDACCAATFVRALATFRNGSRGGRELVAGERSSVARAALAAARAAGIEATSEPRTRSRLGSHVAFVVTAWRPVQPLSGPPRRRCCRNAALRAAFLACGSIADPHRQYHLEFFCRDDESARLLAAVLALLRVDAGVGRRRGRALVYVKGAQAAAEALVQLGAPAAALVIFDVRATREAKNATQRRVNSEAANASRAASSSARQRAVAERIIRRMGLMRLPRALAEAARLRIAHPDHTLAELAARARPPVTKSTMAYRMRELEKL